MSERILVVDDDEAILRTLRINLRARGYDVEAVTTGRDALESLSSHPPAVVILDLGLPDLDGVQVLRRIRQHAHVPVVVLSARSQSDDKVEALDFGADDYVTKPFGVDELMARVRALLRRGTRDGIEGAPTFSCPDFTLDFASVIATSGDGTRVHLTPTEWRILAELARVPGHLVAQPALLEAVWGLGYGRESQYLRVFANQIRRKLEPEPSRPRHLITEPGHGYRLVP